MDPAFQVHRLNELGLMRAGDIAIGFNNLLEDLVNYVSSPASEREMAIVRTKLEEACFFAKKALAVNPRYQAQ